MKRPKGNMSGNNLGKGGGWTMGSMGKDRRANAKTGRQANLPKTPKAKMTGQEGGKSMKSPSGLGANLKGAVAGGRMLTPVKVTAPTRGKAKVTSGVKVSGKSMTRAGKAKGGM